MKKIAVLFDYENFHLSENDLPRLVELLSKRGKILIKRAYGEWVGKSRIYTALLQHQIELVTIPSSSKRKNSADIRLVIDAMEVLYTRPKIDTFVIVSGDSDFLPLASRLREFGKKVIRVTKHEREEGQAWLDGYFDEIIPHGAFRQVETAVQQHVQHQGVATTVERSSSNASNIQTQSAKVASSKSCKKLTKAEHCVETASVVSPKLVGLFQEVFHITGESVPITMSEWSLDQIQLVGAIDWKQYGAKKLKDAVELLVRAGRLRQLGLRGNQPVFTMVTDLSKADTSLGESFKSDEDWIMKIIGVKQHTFHSLRRRIQKEWFEKHQSPDCKKLGGGQVLAFLKRLEACKKLKLSRDSKTHIYTIQSVPQGK